MISLIIPTYNEKENIQELIGLITKEMRDHALSYEIIVVDDNSPDGTGLLLDSLSVTNPHLKVLHRRGKQGLSSAVVEGIHASRGELIGVMDADLSHPADKIPLMAEHLMQSSDDVVIGSRYVTGGAIEGWNLYRKILSKGATFLARVFIDVKDPMSGFFLVRRSLVEGSDIRPRGFKILLDILMKTEPTVKEIPITFINRTAGKSKAGPREILRYLHNLITYVPYKHKVIFQFIKFSFVGLVGTFINLAVLYVLTEIVGLHYLLSALVAFCIAVTSNFLFNSFWTFRRAWRESVAVAYARYLSVSVGALALNIFFLYIFTEWFGIYYLVSQIFAIGLTLIINFGGNKIWTFR